MLGSRCAIKFPLPGGDIFLSPSPLCPPRCSMHTWFSRCVMFPVFSDGKKRKRPHRRSLISVMDIGVCIIRFEIHALIISCIIPPLAATSRGSLGVRPSCESLIAVRLFFFPDSSRGECGCILHKMHIHHTRKEAPLRAGEFHCPEHRYYEGWKEKGVKWRRNMSEEFQQMASYRRIFRERQYHLSLSRLISPGARDRYYVRERQENRLRTVGRRGRSCTTLFINSRTFAWRAVENTYSSRPLRAGRG